MKKYQVRIYFILILILTQLFIPLHSAASSDRPYNILIINAYHYTYPWTFDQNNGFTTAMTERFPDAVIYTEFLDWKRFPDLNLMSKIKDTLSYKYKDIPIDLIVTTDDMGLTFALDNRETLFSNAPITFSGIIEFSSKAIIGDHINVTGVYEQMDPTGALLLTSTLQPDVDKIYLVHDLSESGLNTSENLQLAINSFKTTKSYDVEDLSQHTFSELLTIVEKLKDNSVIYMISYNQSIDGQPNKPEIYGELLTSASSVPVYTIDEFLLDHGVIGGTFLSGQLQGVQLANLGISVLEGTEADSIPHVSKATVYTAVDENILIKYNIKKTNLDSSVMIINEHLSFYAIYKETVIITSLIIATLMFFIILLIINIRKRRLSEVEILANNLELQVLYEQLQASEEELRVQNEELESYQDQLVHDARYDALTNLPNRHYLTQYGSELIQKCTRESSKLIVFFIDLDNFRYINNTHGHFFGDALLKSIAADLDAISDNQFTVRFGGDEFVFLTVVDASDLDSTIQYISEQLKQIFIQPFTILSKSVNISSSIGYSVYPDNSQFINELILQADMAMYESKKFHNAYPIQYMNGMREHYEDTFALISNMKPAFKNNEFILYYQPQIDLKTNKVIGVEALLRWFSDEFGHVAPSKFIPLAESTGFIITLGEFVMHSAMTFAKEVIPYVCEEFKVSINVSVIQLMEKDFVDIVISHLKNTNLDPKYIQIEITESVLIESYDLVIERLNQIQKLGISLSLDDFGTGYSSLSHLQQLPISELKIDKIFIDHILTNNTKELELVDAIMSMAKTSSLIIIAEGVEEQVQIDYLKEKGCDRIQGYYYSKPLSIEDTKSYLNQIL